MIALIRHNHPNDTLEPDHEQFLSMLPRIRYLAAVEFRRLKAEAREELTAEAVALAYCMFARLVSQGKQNLAFATPLAQFAIRQARAGRRVGCRLNRYDITSTYCRRIHGFEINQLGDCSPRTGDWRQLVVEDRSAGPAETAAARIDLADWFRALPLRSRNIARSLATGEQTAAVARRFGVTPGRISQLRAWFLTSWERFQDEKQAAGYAA